MREDGIDFKQCANAFLKCSAPERLQQFANSLTPWDLLTCSQKWLARLTPFFTAREREQSGYQHPLFFSQVEFCDNLIFHRRAALDNLGERLLDANRTIGQPNKITVIFGRRMCKHYRGKLQTEIEDMNLPNPVIRSHCGNGNRTGTPAARDRAEPRLTGDRVRTGGLNEELRFDLLSCPRALRARSRRVNEHGRAANNRLNIALRANACDKARGQPDQMKEFVSAVLGSAEVQWTELFAQSNSRYQAPTLVMFSGATPSACGFAQSAMGPFYCPLDSPTEIALLYSEKGGPDSRAACDRVISVQASCTRSTKSAGGGSDVEGCHMHTGRAFRHGLLAGAGQHARGAEVTTKPNRLESLDRCANCGGQGRVAADT